MAEGASAGGSAGTGTLWDPTGTWITWSSWVNEITTEACSPPGIMVIGFGKSSPFMALRFR
jgi:hypothetical protein